MHMRIRVAGPKECVASETDIDRRKRAASSIICALNLSPSPINTPPLCHPCAMQPLAKRAKLSSAPTLPHQRADCPLYLFHHAPVNSSQKHNLQHCLLCYCLVCDCPVDHCVAWQIHCMGFYTHPEWRVLRYTKSPVVPRHLVPPKLREADFVDDRFDFTVDVDRDDDVVVGGGVQLKSVVELDSHIASANNPEDTPANKPEIEKSANEITSLPVSPVTPVAPMQQKRVISDVENSSGASANSVNAITNNFGHRVAFQNAILDNRSRRQAKPRQSDPDWSISDREVKTARRNWTVDKLFPAPHITRKQNSSAPAFTGKPFPQRVLLGYIDMWRPYCSHMTAKSIELPVGLHANDVASIASKTDVRVPGLRANESEVIAREMGLDLDEPDLYDDIRRDRGDRGDEEDRPDMSSFIGRSSYANEDGTPMCYRIPEAMLVCIRANLLEVRFELSHYAESKNKDKAFSLQHSTFSKLHRSVRWELEKQQCDWLVKCEQRVRLLEKLDTTNCCRLRAWIYLAPACFTSNMVAAVNFCQLESADAHFSPLDCKGNLPRDARRSLAVVLSVLRCHEKGYVASVGMENPTKRYPSVLEATTADGCSIWGSLCYSNNQKKDASLLSNAQKLIDDLRAVSNEHSANTANKASIRGVLSSPSFTVSDGYRTTLRQPAHIKLSLRRYQLESLAWMLDQEKKRSISDPFWVSIHGFDKDNKAVTVFYCPMTGTMSRFAPPPVVGGVFAEEVGLGKTIIAASLITSTLREARTMFSKSNEYRRDLHPSHGTLIVCRVSLLKQWEKELRSKVSPPLSVLCWYGSHRTYDPAVLASYDVVLTTYGILSSGSYEVLLNVHWFRVIIDESTYLNGGSDYCDSELMSLISSRRWAISGTPFGDDFKKKFMRTMRFIGVSPFARSAHFQHLDQIFTTPLHNPNLLRTLSVPHFAYVMKNIMMRHVKAQKIHGQPLVELPPASGRCVLIKLDPNEKQEYEKLEEELKQIAERYLCNQKTFGSHVAQLAQMARLLRIKADGVDPGTLKPVSKQSTENTKSESSLVVRRTSRQVGAKVKQLLRDLRAHHCRDSRSKFVVFTEFNFVKAEIKRYLEVNGFGVMTLDDSMSATRRGRIIKKFEEDPDVAVLVLSMAAGACGSTLTMANVVVLFEVRVRRGTELKAVNQIHCIDQTRPVRTLTYVATGTIDERIVEVRKRRGKPGVVGEDPEGAGEELSSLEVYRSIFAYEE